LLPERELEVELQLDFEFELPTASATTVAARSEVCLNAHVSSSFVPVDPGSSNIDPEARAHNQVNAVIWRKKFLT
jgi:hypothetical protein